MKPSLFFFEFRMLPWSASVNLKFDDALLPEQFLAVCTRDLLFLQKAAFPNDFDRLLALAQDLATSLIDAHAYFAYPDSPPLGVEPVHWFEVKESGPKSTVFGYSDLSLELVDLIQDHRDNAPFIKAFDLMPHIQGLGSGCKTSRHESMAES